MSLVEILIKGNSANQSPMVREIQLRRDVVSVIVYNPINKTVALAKQHQAGAELHQYVNPFLIGTFAGIKEEGENDLEAAKRELLEESGLEIPDSNFISISCAPSFSSAGGSSERVRIFIALTNQELKAQYKLGLSTEEECIDTLIFSLAEAINAIRDGIITTNSAIISLYYIKAFEEKLLDRFNELNA